MRRNAILAGIAVAVVIALGLAVYASPYRAANALREAAEAGDRERLQAFVDFPALRESLKGELDATVIAPMLDKAQGKPYAGLGTVLAGALLGPMVDAMVTPDGVAEMVRRGRPRAATGGMPIAQPPDAVAPSTPPPAAQASATRPQPTMGYIGVNRFLVTFPVAGAGAHDDAFGLIFLRHGLFGWKLSQVRFPPRG